MFQTKATITGCIGAIALAVALFSPTKEITSAEALVGFASGEKVQTEIVQTNKGLIGLLFLAAVGSAVWTATGNNNEQEIAVTPAVTQQLPVPVQKRDRPVAEVVESEPIAGNTLSDFYEQGVSLAEIAQQFNHQTRCQLLRDALVQHEGGWMLRLLRWPVLLVIGRPGSAKSSFAAALGITREVLNPAVRLTVVTDPNAHLKLSKGVWQAHWNLQGSRDSWSEIGEAIDQMYKRFAESTAANEVSSIYDEVTTYKGNVDDKKLGGFLSQVTSKARACGEYITIVAHNDTLQALGGVAGEAKLKDDMAQLNLGSMASAEGLMVPTGKGSIEGLDVDEKNSPIAQSITLPRWFDPEILRDLFPELYLESKSASTNERLRGAYQIANDSLPPPAVSDSLAPGKASVSEPNDGVSALAVRITAARDIQRHIDADLGFELDLPVILLAFEAIGDRKSDTYIIENVLALKGRHHPKGKAALERIKQTFTIED